MKLSFEDFKKAQLEIPNGPVVKIDLSGKVVIVTGANTGLGYEVAKHFAAMNPKRLILASRTQSKGEKALKELSEQTGYKGAEVWLLDLADFASVSAFATKASAELDRLDILVQNAAYATFGEYSVSKHGFETCIQVNDLSTELLSLLLLPKLIETANRFKVHPRLVVVASDMHYWVETDPAIIKGGNIHTAYSSKEYCTPSVMEKRYDLSKLFNVFFVQELQARQSIVTVNAINPGFCYSELRRDLPPERAEYVLGLEKECAFTTEEGARHIVFGATGGQGEEDKFKGAYLSLSRVTEPSDHVLGEAGREIQRAIWDDMVKVLSKVDDRVSSILKEYCSPLQGTS